MDSVPFQYKLVISSVHLNKCSRYDEMLPYLHMCSFTWGCSTDWLGKFFTSFPRCCAYWQLSRNEKRGVVRGNFSHCFCPLWQIIWILNTPTLLAYVPLRWSLRQRLAYRSSEAGEGELATATAAWLLPQCVWGPLCEQVRGRPLLACVVAPGCSRRVTILTHGVSPVWAPTLPQYREAEAKTFQAVPAGTDQGNKADCTRPQRWVLGPRWAPSRNL